MLLRRLVLGCLTGIAFSAVALAAPLKTQAPGWFRYAVGDAMVTALQDGTVDLPPGAYQGIAAEQIQALAARAFKTSPKGVPTSFNAYLIDTGTRRILVDAGNAECYGWKLGRLEANLRASGYQPKDIDTIVLTHMHGDHVCGLVSNNKRLFPKATVWADAEEAAYWLDPANTKTPQGARAAVKLYGQDFRTFKPGDVIAPGLSIVPLHGHTPGHTGFLLTSGAASLLFFGDIVHNHFLQFPHPEASVISDTNRAEAIASRQAVFAKVATDNTAVAGAHLPFPGIGRIRKEAIGYSFVPVEFAPVP